MNDLSALTPPLIMAAIVVVAIIAFLRHEMSRGRGARRESDDEAVAGDPGAPVEREQAAAGAESVAAGGRDGAEPVVGATGGRKGPIPVDGSAAGRDAVSGAVAGRDAVSGAQAGPATDSRFGPQRDR